MPKRRSKPTLNQAQAIAHLVEHMPDRTAVFSPVVKDHRKNGAAYFCISVKDPDGGYYTIQMRSPDTETADLVRKTVLTDLPTDLTLYDTSAEIEAAVLSNAIWPSHRGSRLIEDIRDELGIPGCVHVMAVGQRYGYPDAPPLLTTFPGA